MKSLSGKEIAELVGITAIVVSLIFVGLQLRQAEDIANAADLSEEDRDAFIKSMVQQLASRLEQEPDDLDGWLQLARAYSVLRDAAGEQEAYQNAGRFITDLPQDDPRRVLVETNLAGNGG